MDLEALKNIDPINLEKFLQIAAILGGSQIGGANRQILLKEAVDEYEGYAESNLSPKSLLSIKTANKLLLKYFSPIRPLHTITQKDIEKFIALIKKNAPKGFVVYVRTLRAMFNKFKQWNQLMTNPLEKIKLVKTQSVAPKYLVVDEFERVMSNVENKLIEDFCRVLYDTGLRLGELVFLRWVNVDLVKKVIIVGDDLFTTKTRKQRVVPMSEKVYRILDARYRILDRKNTPPNPLSRGEIKNQFVFGKSGSRAYTGDYFSKQFKAACRAAGVDEAIHMHSLRHSAATRLAQSGAPLVAVQKILGHSSIQTTMIYAHTDLEAMRAAVSLL